MNIKELHETIKNHPYRQNNDIHFQKSYIELVHKLSTAFYYAVKETKYVNSYNMCPDINYCLRYINGIGCGYYIELCIGIIHNFIDTGEVPYYYTYYTGRNTLTMMPALRKHVWVTDKYFLSLSVKEKKECLKEIKARRDAYIKEYKKEPVMYSIFSKEYEEYIKSAIVERR